LFAVIDEYSAAKGDILLVRFHDIAVKYDENTRDWHSPDPAKFSKIHDP
jgi:hypothetical protein